MCKSKIKLHNIIQQLEAEGHLLGIVVTMKGYPAVIVDIIGFSFKKRKKHLWRVCCGSAMSQLIHGNIIHSIKILGVDSICVNQGKHQSKQD